MLNTMWTRFPEAIVLFKAGFQFASYQYGGPALETGTTAPFESFAVRVIVTAIASARFAMFSMMKDTLIDWPSSGLAGSIFRDCETYFRSGCFATSTATWTLVVRFAQFGPFGFGPKPRSVTFSVTLYETLNTAHITVTFHAGGPPVAGMFPPFEQLGVHIAFPGKCHA